ncbi:MAG: hypothetical protein IJ901_04350 [Bacteroidaceae bacterium]|nr:hypothetical protein [Bacteroidaceae bacterium]
MKREMKKYVNPTIKALALNGQENVCDIIIASPENGGQTHPDQPVEPGTELAPGANIWDDRKISGESVWED